MECICSITCCILPPASEGWGKAIFSVRLLVSPHPERVPQSQVLSQVSVLRPFLEGWGTPVPGSFPGLWSQVLSGGVPPGQDWGTLPPACYAAGGMPRAVSPRRTFLFLDDKRRLQSHIPVVRSQDKERTTPLSLFFHVSHCIAVLLTLFPPPFDSTTHTPRQ